MIFIDIRFNNISLVINKNDNDDIDDDFIKGYFIIYEEFY